MAGRVGWFAALFCAGMAFAQIPAPQVRWGPWTEAGSCNGVDYMYSITNDDGRNDPQVRLKVRNGTAQERATRFQIYLYSDAGADTRREGGSRVATGGERDDYSYRLGTPFQTPVNQTLPVRVSAIEFRSVVTSDVSKLPPYATPSTYLDDIRDYPHQSCGPWKISIQQPARAPFISYTEACYNQLPQWTRACQQAVDAIGPAYNAATTDAQKDCVIRWRKFQKCYEIYAYGPNPAVRPQCQDEVPADCELPGR